VSALHPSEVACKPVWSVHVLPKGRDEIGAMLTLLATMPEQWRVLVRQVRRGVNGVSSTSVEISAANTDLSARTERGALQEASQAPSQGLSQAVDAVATLVTQLSASLSFRQGCARVQTPRGHSTVTLNRSKSLTFQSLSYIWPDLAAVPRAGTRLDLSQWTASGRRPLETQARWKRSMK